MKKLIVLLVLLASCDNKPLPVVKPAIERFKDPVCDMWVDKKADLYPLLYDGVLYYFCCNDCALTFSKNTAKYAYKCECKKYRRDCKCDHCAGKQVPCDCR